MDIIETKPDRITIEKKIPFSQSMIWQYQRDFYLNQSINAWAESVPFYVTSNPYIADSYANIIIRFIQDCVRNNSINDKLPFYIVELGAGSGTFSFYILKRLAELKQNLSVDVKLVYVMSDIIESNIKFWQDHESFKPFIDAGELDFAYFDAEASTEIFLLQSGIQLSTVTNQIHTNPMVFIANYCFDSLKHDVFYIKDKTIKEGLCRLETHNNNYKKDQINRLDEVSLSFDYEDIQMPYYNYKVLNDLLSHYRDQLDNQYLSFPIGSIMCMKNLRAISGNKLLVITSDKGYSKHLEIYQQQAPHMVFHDNCFSLSVNFDAIRKYFTAIGGDSFTQFTEQSLTTCSFISGFKFSELHETSLALETYLNSFGHSAINNLFLNSEFTGTLSTIESILPFLGACKWDPRVFNQCRDVIINQIRMGYARIADIEDLKSKMVLIEENVYKLPNSIDSFFDIAMLYQETMDYELALKYYKKSILNFEAKDVTLYNMGLCYYFANKPKKAIDKFSESLVQNPNYIMARGWKSQIEAEII